MCNLFILPFNFSNSFEQHLERLDMVLDRLSECNLKYQLTSVCSVKKMYNVKDM